MFSFFRNMGNAWRFLTIVPLPGGGEAGAADLGRSVACFPLVGLLLGLVALGAAGVLPTLFGPELAAALLVLLLAGVSGGLHLDGLADTADGFLSGRERKKILEIMRDSRVGSMGVLALVFTLLVKVAALAGTSADRLPWVVLLMPVAGRTAIVLSMFFVPYARPEGGLGALFYPPHPGRTALLAVLVCLAAGFFSCGPAGLAACGASFAATLFFCLWCRRKIGGGTGDTFGAACELAEATVAVALAAAPLAGPIFHPTLIP